MLPGIRILFASFILSASVLIFGLGAAALLRSAHEDFVGVPAWRAAQQPMAPAMDTNRPMLSLARVDPPPLRPDIKPAESRPAEVKPDIVTTEEKPAAETKTAALDTQASAKEIVAEKAAAEEAPKVQRKPRVRKAKRSRTATGTTIRHWRAPRALTQEQQPLSTNSPFSGFDAPDQTASGGAGSNRRTAARSPF